MSQCFSTSRGKLTKGQAIEAIIKALPYPEGITKWNTELAQHVEFTWRDNHYRYSLVYGAVEEVANGILTTSTDVTLLMEALINRAKEELCS